MSHPDTPQRSPSRWVILSFAVVIASVLYWLLSLYANPLRPLLVAYTFLPQNPTLEQLMEPIKLLMDANSALVQLATASFAAIAFLVTFTHERGVALGTQAWVLLAAALLFLLGALMSALLARETLLVMLSRNAISISDAPGLVYGRWGFYFFFVLAAMCIGFFAVEVAVSPPPRSLSAGGIPGSQKDNPGDDS